MKKLLFIFIIAISFSQFSNAQWVQHSGIPVHAEITDIERQGEYLYAVAEWGRIFVSSDCGMTWNLSINGLPLNVKIWDALASGNTIYVAAGHEGVYKSTDNGMNWFAANMGITDTVLNLFTYRGELYAGTKGSGLFVSDNGGQSWTQVSLNGLPANPVVNTFYKDGKYIYLGLYQQGVYVSSNGGRSWTSANNGLIQPPNSNPTSFISWGKTLYLGLTNAGVYSTTNNGMTWTKVSNGINANGNSLNDLSRIGSYLFLGSSGAVNGAGRGFYVSSDKGQSWYLMNDGFNVTNSYNIEAIEECGGHVYVGTNGAGLWHRPLEQITMQLNVMAANVIPEATSTKLFDNYPNPFNPTTNLRIQLANAGDVTLQIFDVTGRMVSELVNGKLDAGIHNLTFNAGDLASGVYYYKLVANGFTETKKMLLIK